MTTNIVTYLHMLWGYAVILTLGKTGFNAVLPQHYWDELFHVQTWPAISNGIKRCLLLTHHSQVPRHNDGVEETDEDRVSRQQHRQLKYCHKLYYRTIKRSHIRLRGQIINIPQEVQVWVLGSPSQVYQCMFFGTTKDGPKFLTSLSRYSVVLYHN